MTENIVNTEFIDEMAEKWPSSLCARRSMEKFSGGLYSTRFMANEDYAHRGPEGKVTIGGQVCYPVKNLIKWLKNRTSRSWAERKQNKKPDTGIASNNHE